MKIEKNLFFPSEIQGINCWFLTPLNLPLLHLTPLQLEITTKYILWPDLLPTRHLLQINFLPISINGASKSGFVRTYKYKILQTHKKKRPHSTDLSLTDRDPIIQKNHEISLEEKEKKNPISFSL